MCRGHTFSDFSEVFEAELHGPEATSDVTRPPLTIKIEPPAPELLRGDPVELFSTVNREWVDAEVVEVVQQGRTFSAARRAGSVKVTYDFGTRFVWVGPEERSRLLRPSSRPSAPVQVAGTVAIEEAGWVFTSWRQVHFDIKSGVLAWYELNEEGRRGKLAGSFHLHGLQCQRGDISVIRLRTDNSTASQGFQLASLEEVRPWVEALEAHAEYREELSLYHRWLGETSKDHQNSRPLPTAPGKKHFGGA